MDKISSELILDLPSLTRKYDKWLFDDFLPFMDKHIVDHQKGGFMCNADMNGNLLSTDKNSWYIGRGLWVYSFLYNNFTRDQHHLNIAQKAADFILAAMPQGEDLWHAEFTKNGEPVKNEQGVLIGGKYVNVGKQVYGDLFIAEGLAEYSKALGQQQFWNLAKAIVLKCVRIYNAPGYAPAAARVYMNSETDLPGSRLLGVWMVLLRVCTQMLKIQNDIQIESIAQTCVDAILNHHYNPEYGLINEVLNHDFSSPENEYKHMVYTGHAIETLWMLMDEALRKRDMGLFEKAAKLFKFHLEASWDDIYGGFYRCLKNVFTNQWVLDKAGWLQEEAMIGTLLIVTVDKSPWAQNWYGKILKYVENTIVLEKYGLPLWNPWAQRQGRFEFKMERIENYHHPRHLMLNLLLLRSLTEGVLKSRQKQAP